MRDIDTTVGPGRSMREVVQSRIDRLGIRPHEALGQHFLVNQSALVAIATQVIPGNRVIEVGSGPGQLTEALAATAGNVVGIEIDKRYAPVLDAIAETRDNVEIVYGDALTFPWDKHNPRRNSSESGLQVVSNLPYHISEPFMRRLITLNVDNAVLVLGRRLIEEMTASQPEGPNFGNLTLLTQAFFTTESLATLGRDDFMPAPRTESGIIKLTPRDLRDEPLSKRDHVFRALFLSERKGPSVGSVLKDSLMVYESTVAKRSTGKREKNRSSRRQSKQDLKQLAYEHGRDQGLDEEVVSQDRLVQGQRRIIDWIQDKGATQDMLQKPFRLLDNADIRRLAKALS
jgi:16S rRNA (adenine1518-N6/adenine1519-N6)-dimethyltransferase